MGKIRLDDYLIIASVVSPGITLVNPPHPEAHREPRDFLQKLVLREACIPISRLCL